MRSYLCHSLLLLGAWAANPTLTHNGAPAVVGAYSYTAVTTLSADNGMIRYNFGAYRNGLNLVGAWVDGVQLANNDSDAW